MIERYEPFTYHDGAEAIMEFHPQGDYVEYEQYVELYDELMQTRKMLEDYREAAYDYMHTLKGI